VHRCRRLVGASGTAHRPRTCSRAVEPATPAVSSDRPPQARVLRHAELMQECTLAILAEEGWAGLTMVGVARRMGMSPQVVRSRVRGRAELAALVWEERAGEAVGALISACAEALDAALSGGGPEPLMRAWEACAGRGADLDAGAELLVLAHFNDLIAEAVLTGLMRQVRPWVCPVDCLEADQSARAARYAYAISLGLGILMLARHDRARTAGMERALRSRAIALTMPAIPRPLPDLTASYLLDAPELAPGDPALDILLNVTLALIAERGYDGVRVAEIARAAGFTEGLIYSRYRGKLELFQDAVRRQNEVGLKVNHAFVDDLRREHGLGMAEAVQLREYQLPSNRIPRVMALEQMRMSWHDPALMSQAEAVLDYYRAGLMEDPGWQFEGEADFFLNYAISVGAALVPSIAPDAYRLPYDVVTVPLFDLLQAQ